MTDEIDRRNTRRRGTDTVTWIVSVSLPLLLLLTSYCIKSYRVAKKLAHFVLYALTSSNIDRF